MEVLNEQLLSKGHDIVKISVIDKKILNIHGIINLLLGLTLIILVILGYSDTAMGRIILVTVVPLLPMSFVVLLPKRKNCT